MVKLTLLTVYLVIIVSSFSSVIHPLKTKFCFLHEALKMAYNKQIIIVQYNSNPEKLKIPSAQLNSTIKPKIKSSRCQKTKSRQQGLRNGEPHYSTKGERDGFCLELKVSLLSETKM